MSRMVFNLGIEFDNKKFGCSSIGILEDSKEFFYHFLFIEKTITKNGGFNSDIESGINDHISFHKDGTIHIKTKKHKGKNERFLIDKLENSILDYNTYGMFPLVIDSFFLLEKYRIINEINLDPKVGYYFWRLNSLNKFSIVTFLMRSVDAYNGRLIVQNGIEKLCPPDDKQISMWLDNLDYRKWLITTHQLSIELFNGWYLYITLSPFVIINNTFKELDSNERIINSRVFSTLPPRDLSITFLDKDNLMKSAGYQII